MRTGGMNPHFAHDSFTLIRIIPLQTYVLLVFMLLQTQLTDFENAAYTVFVVLLTRVILSYKLNFIIPISKVQYPHRWN